MKSQFHRADNRLSMYYSRQRTLPFAFSTLLPHFLSLSLSLQPFSQPAFSSEWGSLSLLPNWPQSMTLTRLFCLKREGERGREREVERREANTGRTEREAHCLYVRSLCSWFFSYLWACLEVTSFWGGKDKITGMEQRSRFSVGTGMTRVA